MKEKILEILSQLGFEPELVSEGLGYRFEYEGLVLLFSCEDLDSNALTLIVPSIFDVTPENRLAALEAIAALSSNVRFTQPSLTNDSVWLNYQHFIGDDSQPTPELLEHMVRVLAYSTLQFHKFIRGEKNDQ